MEGLNRFVGQVNKDASIMGEALEGKRGIDNKVGMAAARTIALTSTIVSGVMLPITFTAMVISLASIAGGNLAGLAGIAPFALNIAIFATSVFALYKLQPQPTLAESFLGHKIVKGVLTKVGLEDEDIETMKHYGGIAEEKVDEGVDKLKKGAKDLQDDFGKLFKGKENKVINKDTVVEKKPVKKNIDDKKVVDKKKVGGSNKFADSAKVLKETMEANAKKKWWEI